jgi:hypothetical protein
LPVEDCSEWYLQKFTVIAMNKSDILTLFDYNYWANARVLNAAAQPFTGGSRFHRLHSGQAVVS